MNEHPHRQRENPGPAARHATTHKPPRKQEHTPRPTRATHTSTPTKPHRPHKQAPTHTRQPTSKPTRAHTSRRKHTNTHPQPHGTEVSTFSPKAGATLSCVVLVKGHLISRHVYVRLKPFPSECLSGLTRQHAGVQAFNSVMTFQTQNSAGTVKKQECRLGLKCCWSGIQT